MAAAAALVREGEQQRGRAVEQARAIAQGDEAIASCHGVVLTRRAKRGRALREELEEEAKRGREEAAKWKEAARLARESDAARAAELARQGKRIAELEERLREADKERALLRHCIAELDWSRIACQRETMAMLRQMQEQHVAEMCALRAPRTHGRERD